LGQGRPLASFEKKNPNGGEVRGEKEGDGAELSCLCNGGARKTREMGKKCGAGILLVGGGGGPSSESGNLQQSFLKSCRRKKGSGREKRKSASYGTVPEGSNGQRIEKGGSTKKKVALHLHSARRGEERRNYLPDSR